MKLSGCKVKVKRIRPYHRCNHRCATRYTSPVISLSHGLRHFHTHFWQVHLFEFQYKCITEKCILPFYKRPGQKHNFIFYTYKILHLYLPEMSVRMTYPSMTYPMYAIISRAAERIRGARGKIISGAPMT